MNNSIALITGASGFTGQYLIPELKSRGFRVVGLGHGVSLADKDISCNLIDADAVISAVQQTQPTHVVHLAAISFVGHGDPHAFYDVNLFGTLHLLEALWTLSVAPQKILVASSANVYGTPGIDVIDESVCPAPLSHYACSKLAMEQMVRTWFDRLPIVIIRPFNYTGVGQDEKFLIPKIVSHFKRREKKIELGNIDVSRDFSDVRDVVAAYVALLGSEIQSEVFNVCSGQAVPLRKVLDMMAYLTKLQLKVDVKPALIRNNEIPILCGSYHKLAQAVGFAPHYTLEDTLAWMLSKR